jgi:hypothetical protein
LAASFIEQAAIQDGWRVKQANDNALFCVGEWLAAKG